MKTIKIQTLALLLVLLCSSLSLLAQNKASISGKISTPNTSISFAQVALYADSSIDIPLFSIQTDSTQLYHFDNLTAGNYVLKIDAVGYKSIVQNVTIATQNMQKNIGEIVLKTTHKKVKNVLITAQKKAIVKTNEGFVINAAANIAQAGGTATDLLKSTPTVAVDADGGITLRGKTPLILINGRTSNLTNTDQIPASSIETIEIINNASAKYDANAESGIINITLKKNKQSGTNGAIALGAGMGSRGRVSSSVLLNHKTNKWNIGIGLDNKFAGRTKHIQSNRTNDTIPTNYQLTQNRNDERTEKLQNVKCTVDYAPNDKNTFSLEAIATAEGQDNNENLQSYIYNQNASYNYGTERKSVEIERSKIGELTFLYNKKYSNEKKSLLAGINSSLEKNRENTSISTENINETSVGLGNTTWQQTHNYEDNKLTTANLDYSLPIAKNGILDMGYKGTFRSIQANYAALNLLGNVYVTDTTVSNIFHFAEQVNALYVQYNNSFGKDSTPAWHYQLGLRAEQLNNNGHTQNSSTTFTNNYINLFPTANISFASHSNQLWKLSYAKRINRPNLGQLNPFIDITDALNPHTGNPYLQPEIIHALELSHNIEGKKYSLSNTVFYRHSTNTIRGFYIPEANGVTLRKPMNIGTANSYGIENMVSAKPTTWYDFNTSIALMQQTLDGSNILGDAVQSAFNWYAKCANNFAISKKSKLQLLANYNSSLATPQGKQIPLYNVDMGYQQKLGKGKARLGIVVVDIFNTLKSGYNNFTNTFTSIRTSKADTRAFMLTYAYAFRTAIKEKMLENQFSKEY